MSLQLVARWISAYALPALLGAAIIYFSYHALAGKQGLGAWTELQRTETAMEKQLATLQAQRDTLDKSLARLRDGSLDLDYVEEIARTKLSYVRPDEVLVAVR